MSDNARIIQLRARPSLIEAGFSPDLARRIDTLLAAHPDTDEVTLICRQVALLTRQIDAAAPGYARWLQAQLQQRLRQLSP